MIAFFETPPPIVSPAPATSSPGISERSLLDDRLARIVADAKAKTGGTLGVVVWDLGTNVLAQRNAEDPFPMANAVKLAIAFTAYRDVERGRLRIESVRDPLARMLQWGDASSTDALYRLVGTANGVNEALRDAGVDAVVIQTNESGNGSPSAVALLLSQLAKGKYRLPPRTTFHAATDAMNSAGLTRLNGRDVVVVAMLQGASGTSRERNAILASVASAAADATRLFPL